MQVLSKEIRKIKDNKKFWIILFGIQFVLEYMLFRSYALREAVDTIPRNMDPMVYLRITYETYFKLLRGEYADAARTLFFGDTACCCLILLDWPLLSLEAVVWYLNIPANEKCNVYIMA